MKIGAGNRPAWHPRKGARNTAVRDTVSFVARAAGAALTASFASGGGVRTLAPLGFHLACGALESEPLVSVDGNQRRANLKRSLLPALLSTAGSLTQNPLLAAGLAVAGTCLDEFCLKPMTRVQPRELQHMPVARANMEIPKLWKKGLTGKGVTVAVLDTGGSAHLDLGDRQVAFHDAVGGHSQKLYDGHRHGTLVSSLVAGDGALSNGRFAGAAPEANLAVVRAMKGKTSGLESMISGLEWVLENQDKHNIKVLNLSIRLKEIDPKKQENLRQQYARLFKLVDQAAKRGIIPVVAAGNNGKTDHLHLLSMSRNVISVANYDTRGTLDPGDDRIVSTSARPRRFKTPDVAAVGQDVVYADARGGYTHLRGGGTSSATAWVSGIVAAWVQAYPDLTVEEALQAIKATSRPLKGVSPRAQGAGLIQADKAQRWLARHRGLEENS